MEPNDIPSWKRPAAAGYGLIFLTFGVCGGWSAIAKIDSAAVAPGVVMVESNRKTVAHLEGGIVGAILVREGEHVVEGQPLIRLDTTQSHANFAAVQNQLDANLAIEARLVAERDDFGAMVLPDELRDRSDDAFLDNIVADQNRQFQERRASLSGQVGILEKKVTEYQTEIDGITRERSSVESQVELIEQELTSVRSLLDRDLVPITRYLALERERARLEGTIGRAAAEIAKAANGISEANLQIRQLRQKFREDVSASMSETRQKISDLREKLAIASDVLRRSEITAPRSGVLQNLRVFTVGGIIRPGESVAEIVPDHEELIVQAHVSPLDVDRVLPGMTAEVRFSAFHTSVMPLILGRVDSVSRDRLTDEASRQVYFLAQVTVEEATFPAEIKNHLVAGMPADVLVPTGERTLLSYLARPLYERMSRSMRER